MADALRWYESDPAVRRFVTDLLIGEMEALRPGCELPDRPWPDGLRLDHTGLDCDSLELMALATAVAEATHMHRSGVEDYLLARRTFGDWVAVVGASLGRFSDTITFRSSGTTATPAAHPHDLAELVQEIRELSGLAPHRQRVLSAVPAHHIYGFLFTVLMATELELPVLDIRRRSTAWLANELRAGDVIIGHPAFWSMVARGLPAIPPGVVGVTSTAPCPAELAAAVLDRGLDRLVQVYGSSETSGIGWRDTPSGSYQLLSHWRREDDATLIRARPGGSTRRHPVPDRLAWSDAQRFEVLGRHDGAVQIGGINVIPDAVGARLLEHPAVADAAVRAMRPDEGSRLKAFIVPHEADFDPVRLTVDLTHWSNCHLAVPERPKSFSFGRSLPRGQLGKLADWPLAPSSPFSA